MTELSTRLQVRKIGAARYPWVTICGRCWPRTQGHLVPDVGAVVVNHMVGNRTHAVAIAAVSAHITWHRYMDAPKASDAEVAAATAAGAVRWSGLLDRLAQQ